MKIYEWTPNGHGSCTFVVVDESEEAAKARADVEVARLRNKKGWSDGWSGDYITSGWDTDYYTLAVHELDSVLSFPND